MLSINDMRFEKVPDFSRKIPISNSDLSDTNQCEQSLIKMEESTCCTNLRPRNKWSKKRGLQDSGLSTFAASLSVSGIGSFHNRTTLFWDSWQILAATNVGEPWRFVFQAFAAPSEGARLEVSKVIRKCHKLLGGRHETSRRQASVLSHN